MIQKEQSLDKQMQLLRSGLPTKRPFLILFLCHSLVIFKTLPSELKAATWVTPWVLLEYVPVLVRHSTVRMQLPP